MEIRREADQLRDEVRNKVNQLFQFLCILSCNLAPFFRAAREDLAAGGAEQQFAAADRAVRHPTSRAADVPHLVQARTHRTKV